MSINTFANHIKATELRGYGVLLTPLAPIYIEGLGKASEDGKLYELNYTSVPSPDQVENYIEQALLGLMQGKMIPFAVIDEKTQEVLGSTRYHDISAGLRRLEIGYTWYAKSHQRTAVNTICKYLLLKHAFETMQANVVGWRTDPENLRSQKAIERLGAKKDGVIRGFRTRRDGALADAVMYSLTAAEWLSVKNDLKQKIKGE